MKRRVWLLSGLAAGGAMLVGWSVLPARERLGSATSLPNGGGAVALNGWLKIDLDGHVLLAMNRSEMGQGVHTALAMLVAEELDVPLAMVRLIPAGYETIYGNVAGFVAGLVAAHPRDIEAAKEPVSIKLRRHLATKLARELGINMTGGSSSVADAWEVLRLAAATARRQLLNAASLEWRLPVAEFEVVDGVITHPSGQRAPYQNFADRAPLTPPGTVTLKARSAWTLIGTSAPRIDAAVKANGRAIFGIDERQPDQLFAVIRHAPALGGAPGRVDADTALRQPGVVRVVRLGAYAGSPPAIAVVGISLWHAQRGADALTVDWLDPPHGRVDSATIMRSLENAALEAARTGAGTVFYRRGNVDSAVGDRRLLAVYRAPYLAHAAMEPVNATARVSNGMVEVWAPTQVPGLSRALAAQVAGVDETAVHLTVSYLGGGFGRRLETAVVGQVVRIAMECGGAPVQLVWPREQDFGHDVYRPAAVAVMQAELDGQGRVVAIRAISAGDAITPRWLERNLPAMSSRFEMPDQTTSEGLYDSPYDIPHQRIAHLATHSGVPVGYWRSVGHSHNAFFNECFIDELATAAGDDPVAFRLGLLADMPRHAEVLRLAAERAGWPGFGGAGPRKLAPGRALGVALHESFGSIVAQVAEVSVQGSSVQVHRVVVAADVGTVINPDIVAQQLEGGVIFGLTAALHGRIDIVDSVVVQSNFHNHPLLSLAQSPVIETHLIASERTPAGVGEIATPPIAPAVANALFVLTGLRSRDLPLMPLA
ncbi:MAG: molybdopterin cofactor-binding domain-containing protein [Ideonella sp.]